jgi:histidinol dehydrogenase
MEPRAVAVCTRQTSCVSTIQRMTRLGLKTLAPTVIMLAREEGLEAHARSIEVRLRRGPQRGTRVGVAL